MRNMDKLVYMGVACLFLLTLFGCKVGKGGGKTSFLESDIMGQVRISSGAFKLEGINVNTPLWSSGDIKADTRFDVKPLFDVKQDFNFNFRKPWPMMETVEITTTTIKGKAVPVQVITRTPIIANSPLEKILYLVAGFCLGFLAAHLGFFLIRIIFAKHFRA